QIGGSKSGIEGGEICRNTITGRDLPNGAGNLCNGIMLAGASNVNVYDNKVQGGIQSGLYFDSGRGLNVHDNTVTGFAPGGIFAVRIENVTDSVFQNNSVTKVRAGEDDRFVEIGKSSNNVYSGNRRGGVVLLRGSSEKSHQ
ncbi:MAG: right-handed parallel beta-helix repeat-containing protein, partial [Acidobacteria bacterium]|nr:right-handed parallel beta-helix repeat-containing protein [Acidobacteriota bacterium]